jgi:hypothetical protein
MSFIVKVERERERERERALISYYEAYEEYTEDDLIVVDHNLINNFFLFLIFNFFYFLR